MHGPGRRYRVGLGALAAALLVATLALSGSPVGARPAPQAADWDIPNGHFFTQTGPGNGYGFSVVDDADAKFWTEFKRLGGVAVLGYPMSKRFVWGPSISQVLQRGVFQWRPETGTADFVNVLDVMSEVGLDDWLSQNRIVPKPLPADFDAPGTSAFQAAANRLALIEDPDMVRAYYAAPDPTLVYGLPSSRLTDMGPALVIRFQRSVMQKWKTEQPWAKAGDVTVANGGSLAVEVGLIDNSVLQPIQAPAPAPGGATAGAATVPARPPAGAAATATSPGGIPVVNLTPPARGTASPAAAAATPTRGGTPAAPAGTAAPQPTVVGTVDPNVPVAGLAGGAVPSPAAAPSETPPAPAATPTTVPAASASPAAASGAAAPPPPPPPPASGGTTPPATAAASATATTAPAATRPGGQSGNAVPPQPNAHYDQFGRIKYEKNCDTAWVQGRIYDAAGRPVNGATVLVKERNGFRQVSRPSGAESDAAPDGLFRVILRSGADQVAAADLFWTVQVVGPDGQAMSDEIAFETDKDCNKPDARQVVVIDFKAK